MSLVWAVAWDHVNVQGLCKAGSALHWLQQSGELTPPPHLDSTVEMGREWGAGQVGGGAWVSQPESESKGRAGKRCPHTQVGRRTGPRVMKAGALVLLATGYITQENNPSP